MMSADRPAAEAVAQLLLGKVQRRRRRKDAAAQNLAAARQAFKDLGTPLWAAQPQPR